MYFEENTEKHKVEYENYYSIAKRITVNILVYLLLVLYLLLQKLVIYQIYIKNNFMSFNFFRPFVLSVHRLPLSGGSVYFITFLLLKL